MHQDTEIDLWLIRHGEADHNLLKDRVGGGRHDGNLTELGAIQATDLGNWLAEDKVVFDAIHASGMRRAIQTARIIKSCLKSDLEISENVAFNELDQGLLEAMSRAEAYTPRRQTEMDRRSMDFQPPGGESQRQLQRRAMARLEELITNNAEILQSGCLYRVAIVTHKVTIDVMLQSILGSERSLCWRQAIRNTSFSRIWFNVDGWWPECINATPHLPITLNRSNRIV